MWLAVDAPRVGHDEEEEEEVLWKKMLLCLAKELTDKYVYRLWDVQMVAWWSLFG